MNNITNTTIGVMLGVIFAVAVIAFVYDAYTDVQYQDCLMDNYNAAMAGETTQDC